MEISIEKTKLPKKRPHPKLLGFGRFFTDHMFVSRFNSKRGWIDARVQPYQPILMDPGASVLQYGQTLFEGMKAFRDLKGNCVIFRPHYNWQRMKAGAERLCLPTPPEDLFLNGIKELIKMDLDWLPEGLNSSLYIRPVLIGTEPFLGVRPSEEAIFFIILFPIANSLFSTSTPIRIWVEKNDLRAAPGGVGSIKTAANYAVSLKATIEAKKKDCDQVLWLDFTKTFIEEVGTMNIFFVYEEEIVTPSLDGTILPGATRDTLIYLIKKRGLKISERKVLLHDVLEGAQSGRLKEVFGTGTAAVVTPIGEMISDEFSIKINSGELGALTDSLTKEFKDLLRGEIESPDGWLKLHPIIADKKI